MKILLKRFKFASRLFAHALLARDFKATYWESLGLLSSEKVIVFELNKVNRNDGTAEVDIRIVDRTTHAIVDKGPSSVVLDLRPGSRRKMVAFSLDAMCEVELAKMCEAWDAQGVATKVEAA